MADHLARERHGGLASPYAGGLSEAEVADCLASAVGHVGTMAEYLLNTVIHLEEAGIHDRALWRMQAMVAERLERLPAISPDNGLSSEV